MKDTLAAFMARLNIITTHSGDKITFYLRDVINGLSAVQVEEMTDHCLCLVRRDYQPTLIVVLDMTTQPPY